MEKCALSIQDAAQGMAPWQMQQTKKDVLTKDPQLFQHVEDMLQTSYRGVFLARDASGREIPWSTVRYPTKMTIEGEEMILHHTVVWYVWVSGEDVVIQGKESDKEGHTICRISHLYHSPDATAEHIARWLALGEYERCFMHEIRRAYDDIEERMWIEASRKKSYERGALRSPMQL